PRHCAREPRTAHRSGQRERPRLSRSRGRGQTYPETRELRSLVGGISAGGMRKCGDILHERKAIVNVSPSAIYDLNRSHRVLGLQYKHWRGDSYPADLPPDRWLEFYAARFDTVEINNSSY